MSGTTPVRASRFDVRSRDGTPLAVWVEGDGPPIVLVHGSIQDHTVSAELIHELRTDFATFSMDRRGFGASGDRPDYTIGRDFEDVAAVVENVAARTAQRVALWGHSYGANCAMGGAALTDNVGHLLLSGSDSPPDVKKATDDALAALPHARVHVLAGHAHIAHRTDPALVAAIIREFLAA